MKPTREDIEHALRHTCDKCPDTLNPRRFHCYDKPSKCHVDAIMALYEDKPKWEEKFDNLGTEDDSFEGWRKAYKAFIRSTLQEMFDSWLNGDAPGEAFRIKWGLK